MITLIGLVILAYHVFCVSNTGVVDLARIFWAIVSVGLIAAGS